MSKYIDLYPDTFSGIGLLSQISELTSIPWANSIDPNEVEILYANRSANKNISGNFSRIRDDIRPLIVSKYYFDRWKRLWDTYKLEYNEITPYSVTESGEHTKTNRDTTTNKFGKEISEEATDTGTVTNNGTDTGNTERDVYGYNSVSAVPSEVTNDSGTSNATETRDLTGNRTVTNSGEDVENKDGLEEYDYSLNKSGNLGFITTQDMIKKEMDLWTIPYLEKVFADVDSLIALKIY